MRSVIGRLQAINWNQVSTLTLVTLLVLSGTVATVGVAPAAATAGEDLDARTTEGLEASDSGSLSSTDGSFSPGSLLQIDDWPTAGRDPGRSGHSSNGTGPTTGPEARWIHEFEDDDTDIPAVAADGLVFVPGWDSVRAVDADTGDLVWNASESGIGSVTTSQGLVITTATDYSDGDWIRAYHAANGTEAWNVSFEADTSVAFGGAFYAVRGEYLYAYDLQTGAQLWSVDLNEDISNGLSAANGTIYATGQVGTRDYGVYALNASDGSERWRFEMEGELSMQPTAVDGSVYVGAGDETYDPKFYRLNATDGHVEWIFDVNTQPRGAAVADGFVYLAAGNTVHALDEETGQREWLHRLAGSIE